MTSKSAAEELSTRLDVSENVSTAKEGEVIRAQDDAASAIARPGEVLPPTLHVLPVSERPFFPGQMMPVMLPEHYWQHTVDKVQYPKTLEPTRASSPPFESLSILAGLVGDQ